MQAYDINVECVKGETGIKSIKLIANAVQGEIDLEMELPRILESLEPHKSEFSVLSGFAQSQGFAHGDGAGGTQHRSPMVRARVLSRTRCRARRSSPDPRAVGRRQRIGGGPR